MGKSGCKVWEEIKQSIGKDKAKQVRPAPKIFGLEVELR